MSDRSLYGSFSQSGGYSQPPPNAHAYPPQGHAYPSGYPPAPQGYPPAPQGYPSSYPPYSAPPSAYPHPYPPPAPAPAAPAINRDEYIRGFDDGKRGSVASGLATWIVPAALNAVLLVAPIWWLRRRFTASMGAKADSKGNSTPPWMEMMMPMKSKNFRVDVKGTTFADVIGVPEAKADLKQYVDFLKDPPKFTRLGARLPKGCLLTGPPGTGKTLLARAVAGEASTPFFCTSGADFIEVFGGSGPRRVRELFAEARKVAPCVVFIDEIDAIGSRGGGRSMGGGASEENRTINQLLAELDGLKPSEAIVVIAATNFPEAIDKALLRDGRFDRKVAIPMPDRTARVELYQYYLGRIITGDPTCKPRPFEMPSKASGEKATDEKAKETALKEVAVTVVPGVSNTELAAVLADRTPGVSPAQISAIVNESALAAAAKGEEYVSLPFLQEGVDDVLIGRRHRQRMADESLRRTAYHECGHAVVAWTNPLQEDVIKVSIIPRGRAGGYTQQVQKEALESHTHSMLFSQLCVLLGGRAAESLFLGDISTGAIDDLQRATKIAMDQIMQYGMSSRLGHLAFKPNDKSEGRAWLNYSEDLHGEAEAEARTIVLQSYNKAEEILAAHREGVRALAERLLQKKEVTREDLIELLGPRPTAVTTA